MVTISILLCTRMSGHWSEFLDSDHLPPNKLWQVTGIQQMEKALTVSPKQMARRKAPEW
jgi:hypothetical protein